MPLYMKFPMVVILSTCTWLLVTYTTKPEKKDVLFNFCQQTNPGGPGWRHILAENKLIVSSWSLPSAILAMLVSLIMIYSLLFATGYFLYGNLELATILFFICLFTAYILKKIWKSISKKNV